MRKIIIINLLLCTLLISCNKDNTIIENDNHSININNNSEELKLRIEYPQEIIEFETKSSKLNYTLVANIDPIQLNGITLSATGIANKGNHVYVCYHSRGAAIGGEVLSLDVSDPNEIIVLQSATSLNYEFNDVSISNDESKLWLCGNEETNGNVNAFAMELSMDMNIPNEEISWTKSIAAYSANSITPSENGTGEFLWISSGSNGGLDVFDQANPNDDAVFSFEANNCKHFSAGRDYGVIIVGVSNNLSIMRVFDLNSDFEYTDYEIPYDVTNLGKNGIHIDRSIAYLAMGDDGLVVFDLRDGLVTDVFKIDGPGNLNSVYAEKETLYLAYGSAGLYIVDKNTMTSLGNWQYDGSCNYVAVDHETIYIANGNGDGFLVLQKN